jgi:hypothetical protein
LSSGSKALLKLHWTINSKRPAGWRRYPPTENLDLPELFWGDLSTILVFIVTANQEQYEHGSFVADQVTSHITKIRKLLEDKGHSWKPEFRLVLLPRHLLLESRQINVSFTRKQCSCIEAHYKKYLLFRIRSFGHGFRTIWA